MIWPALLLLPGLSYAVGAYQPASGWIDPQVGSLAQWEGRLLNAMDSSTGSRGATATLQQARPKGVGLLEDYMLGRHPRLLQDSPARARALIDRQYTRSLGALRGYMAEAVFVDRNPGWNLVKSGTASQHDVTRFRPGERTPFNGQIKYHHSGNPRLYAADMVKDFRAHRFFIPDDHVEPTKAYLRQKAEHYALQGDQVNAKRVWRDYGRTRGIRATSIEIRSLTDDAGRYVAAEQRALSSGGKIRGVKLGAPARSLASAGPYASNVRAALRQQTYRVPHGRYVAAGSASRVNIVIGGVAAVAMTVFLLNEHGGRNALTKPAFYMDAVGAAAALGVGYYATGLVTGMASGTGPWAPVIGFVAGAAAGTAAFVGGRKLAHVLIEIFAPEVLHKWELEKVAVARFVLKGKTQNLQTLE